MSDREDSSSVAVERALAILETVAQRGSLSNSELSRKLEIPKSSASYLLRTLEQRGYLRRERASGKYYLGLKILNLSNSVRVGQDLREIALPAMQQLVEKIHLTTHLGILDHGEAVYIAKVEAPGFFKTDTWVGRRMPVHATAVGKVLIAVLPPAEVEAIIKEQGMVKKTAKTITVASKLMRELEKVSEQGYAIDDEENSPGGRCVAAPVYDSMGLIVAAVGVSGTTTQNDLAHLPKVIEQVRSTARRISQQLGYRTTGSGFSPPG